MLHGDGSADLISTNVRPQFDAAERARLHFNANLRLAWVVQ